MRINGQTLAILGMSGAGKTTYIARLWLSVYERMGRLQAVGLPEQFEPLRDLSAYLLRSEYPHHTVSGSLTSFEVPLRWSGQQKELPFALAFTDYSGEELGKIFERRDAEWSDAWKARSTKSLGLLLFLRPDKFVPPESFPLPPGEDFDSWAFKYLCGDTLPEVALQPLAAENPALMFGPEYQPHEVEEGHRHPFPNELVRHPGVVELVETLQFLRHERGLIMGETPNPESFRIAVVVSRWDHVSKAENLPRVCEQGPESFVKHCFALLYDFLEANFDPTGVRFFGLSATGGDLKNHAYKRQYDDLEPAKVGEVVYHPTPGGSVKRDPDITLPIGWLLEGESAIPDPDAA